MNEEEFLDAVLRAIEKCELSQYTLPSGVALQAVRQHWDIGFDLTAIEKDMNSAGGIKLSHGQRRMLEFLIALWNPREADRLFDRKLTDLTPTIMSMDKENRSILAELIYTFPGWGD